MNNIIKKLISFSSSIILLFIFIQPSSFSATEQITIIEGKVLDIHMFCHQQETVKICHFDPKFVAVLKTVGGIQRLAIHSPVRTFVDDNPIGSSYKIKLEKDEKIFKIKSIEKINP